MAQVQDIEALRRSALEHLWMHNGDWVKMAEEGGPPIMIEGNGIRVTDSEGREWIDVNGGYSSVNAGYGRIEIAEAAREQMLKLAYFPQGSTTEALVKFAEKMAQIAPGNLERTWPVTGGSEANETALKIARAYQKRVGESGRYKIISRRRSYHGATGGVMWTGVHLGRSDYGPPMPGMIFAPQAFPYRCEMGGRTTTECSTRCAQAIDDLILFHDPSTIAALIATPIWGNEVPGDEYWPLVREICDKYGILLIDDEVICGFGRTGKWFAMEHWDVVPDIMTVAKGISSSYLPIAATVVSTKVAEAFAGKDNFLRQSLTFGGHPVAAAAALKNLEIIEEEGLVENSSEVGSYAQKQLMGMMDDHAIIGEVRGRGLLIGVELVSDRETRASYPSELGIGRRLGEKFRRDGLILGSRDTSISISPPLCITRGEIDEILTVIDRALGELEGELANAG